MQWIKVTLSDCSFPHYFFYDTAVNHKNYIWMTTVEGVSVVIDSNIILHSWQNLKFLFK